MGRRVKKTVYDYAAGDWQLNEEKLFVYDGWNLVEEITSVGANDTSRYFVWGLDLSQSLKGAGGIGGLIAAVDGADTYYFAYDGNGNVGQVIDASSGTIAASYQYDPFGNLIKSEGAYADNNPFRFSTKYHDDETGLVYYGYRYYSAEMGRWINRDPLGERGGLNLYVFCHNNGINFLDHLGRFADGPNVLGHDDFPEHREEPGNFDFTAEDYGWTGPFNLLWGIKYHFQALELSLSQADEAIANCDHDRYERVMHRAQDFFSHYDKGYRAWPFHGWHPKHWGPGHAFAGLFGENPDDDPEVWERARIRTQQKNEEWHSTCCKCGENWYRRDEGVCDNAHFILNDDTLDEIFYMGE